MSDFQPSDATPEVEVIEGPSIKVPKTKFIKEKVPPSKLSYYNIYSSESLIANFNTQKAPNGYSKLKHFRNQMGRQKTTGQKMISSPPIEYTEALQRELPKKQETGLASKCSEKETAPEYTDANPGSTELSQKKTGYKSAINRSVSKLQIPHPLQTDYFSSLNNSRKIRPASIAGDDSPQKRAVRENLSIQNQKLRHLQELKSVVQKELDQLNASVLKSEYQRMKMEEKEFRHQLQLQKLRSQDHSLHSKLLLKQELQKQKEGVEAEVNASRIAREAEEALEREFKERSLNREQSLKKAWAFEKDRRFVEEVRATKERQKAILDLRGEALKKKRSDKQLYIKAFKHVQNQAFKEKFALKAARIQTNKELRVSSEEQAVHEAMQKVQAKEARLEQIQRIRMMNFSEMRAYQSQKNFLSQEKARAITAEITGARVDTLKAKLFEKQRRSKASLEKQKVQLREKFSRVQLQHEERKTKAQQVQEAIQRTKNTRLQLLEEKRKMISDNKLKIKEAWQEKQESARRFRLDRQTLKDRLLQLRNADKNSEIVKQELVAILEAYNEEEKVVQEQVLETRQDELGADSRLGIISELRSSSSKVRFPLGPPQPQIISKTASNFNSTASKKRNQLNQSRVATTGGNTQSEPMASEEGRDTVVDRPPTIVPKQSQVISSKDHITNPPKIFEKRLSHDDSHQNPHQNTRSLSRAYLKEQVSSMNKRGRKKQKKAGSYDLLIDLLQSDKVLNHGAKKAPPPSVEGEKKIKPGRKIVRNLSIGSSSKRIQKVYQNSNQEMMQRIASGGSLHIIPADEPKPKHSVLKKLKGHEVSEEDLVKKKRLEFDFGFQYPSNQFKTLFLSESARYREQRAEAKLKNQERAEADPRPRLPSEYFRQKFVKSSHGSRRKRGMLSSASVGHKSFERAATSKKSSPDKNLLSCKKMSDGGRFDGPSISNRDLEEVAQKTFKIAERKVQRGSMNQKCMIISINGVRGSKRKQVSQIEMQEPKETKEVQSLAGSYREMVESKKYNQNCAASGGTPSTAQPEAICEKTQAVIYSTLKFV